MSARLTALSGADALGHAIEAFAAVSRPPVADIAFKRVFVGKNALSDHHARTAIRLIFKWLPSGRARRLETSKRAAR